MTFVDTNYFVRYLLRDNKIQCSKVQELFERAAVKKESLFTSTIVFFEIYWVLASVYKVDKKSIVKGLRSILKLDFIILDERSALVEALKVYSKSNLSLEDCYNLATARLHKATQFATFDQKLLKKFSN